MADRLIDLAVTLVRETEKAWLINDGQNDHWIPKSIGEMAHITGKTYELTVPEWIAIKKELLI